MDTSSPATTSDAPATTAGEPAPHHHSPACFWDHRQASWVCAGVIDGEVPEQPLVDVRDMLVVHTAILREFRLAPGAVLRVPVGGRRHAARVDRHLALVCDLLHHHHSGEDELLWPPLRERLPREAVERLEEAEAQHAALDAALTRVGVARRAWVQQVDAPGRDTLVTELRSLHALLAEHLDDEERSLLPLAASHLTPAEWKAVGEAGAASLPKSVLPLVFGMFAYEGDPEVVAAMLTEAPAPVRKVIPLIAPRAYARRAVQVHGTPRP